jgi:hypothetical protein
MAPVLQCTEPGTDETNHLDGLAADPVLVESRGPAQWHPAENALPLEIVRVYQDWVHGDSKNKKVMKAYFGIPMALRMVC